MRARHRALTGLVAVLLAAALVEPQTTPQVAEAAAAAVTPTDANRPGDRAPERGTAAWARARARATGERQVVVRALTETETVYANPDGSTTTEFTALPTRVRSALGTWVEPDTTLVRRADGTVGPRAAAVDVAFSGGGSELPMVRYAPEGASIEVGWPTALPTPRLEGNKATYADVLPGVDLELLASEVGYAQRFVVTTREAARQPALRALALPVRTNGIEVSSDPSGALEARRPDGSVAFVSPPATMWDSAKALTVADVGVRMTGKQMTLRPDVDMLTDPETVFPVSIDPDLGPGLWGLAMVSSGYPREPYWQGGSDGVAKVGNCTGWAYCNSAAIHRSYFQWATGSLVGKRILAAEFNAYEIYAPSCQPRPVEAKATRELTSTGTTWETQPAELASLGSQSVAHGYSASCPPAYVGWNAINAFPKDSGGVRRADADTTIVLRAPNISTGNYEQDKLAWKKFAKNPTLSVTYNTAPDAPTSLGNEGKACGWAGGRPSINPTQTGGQPRGVKLSSRVYDDDGGDVRAWYEWRELNASDRLWMKFATTAHEGSPFIVDVPVEHAQDGHTYMWRVVGNDFIEDGPVSRWCEVTIDRTKPGTPTVSSADGRYPECEFPDDATEDGCTHTGGAGTAGAFNLGGDSDVVRFQYSIEGGGLIERGTVPAVGGVATSARITPPAEGTNRLQVWAVDAAGNMSDQPQVYVLKVGAGSGPVGIWHLDGRGSDTVAPDATAHRRDATVDVSASPWTRGRLGDALRFIGTDGLALGSTAPMRTDESFAVSAWVNLTAADTQTGVVLSQNGASNSNFQLHYSGERKAWAFGMRTGPTATTAARVYSGPAVAGRWTHLTGVFNAGSNTIRLYVDGVDQGTASVATPWNATGPLQLGRNQSAGTYINKFRGSIDEVRVYDRLLQASDVHDLAVVEAADLQLRVPFDHESGTVGEDVSGYYRHVSLSGASSWVPGRHDDDATDMGQALQLAGGTGTVDATWLRADSSFTVNVWARLDPGCADPGDPCWDSPGTADQVVLESKAGTATNLELRYVGSTGRWRLTGAGTTTPVLSSAPAVANAWTMLTVVYDQALGEYRLYVDGVAAGEVTTPRGGAVANELRLGSSTTPMRGAVDELRVWAGARTDDQIRTTLDDPAPPFAPEYAGQLTRFNTPEGHIVTNGPVPRSAHVEFPLGFPADAGTEGTRTIYSCRNNANDYFLSGDAGCEGRMRIGVIGGLYINRTDQASLPIYRCLVPNSHHFAAHDPGCEGQTTEFLLGYSRPYWHLIRYINSGAPYDHISTSIRVPGRYQEEWSLGILSITDLGAATVPLTACRDDATGDRFTSLDTACEGRTSLHRAGFIWTNPPEGTPSKQLYRCRHENGELFENSTPFEPDAPSEPDCGPDATFDSVLGYLLTQV